MKLLLVLTICVYAWAIVLGQARAQTKISFDLGSSEGYSRSLSSLRSAAKGGTTCQGLPMLSGDNKYVLVTLTGTKTITVVIHLKTLYVEGYSDEYQSNCRSFVTNDASSGAGASLCVGVTAMKLGFEGNYKSLLTNSGKDLTRETFEIGINKLEERMVIAGKAVPEKKAQAQFLLTVVQVVSEATRFTYIERQVGAMANFFPNKRMTSLEDEWGKVSTAVGLADKNGVIPAKSQPTSLKDESGNARVVTKVSDVSGDIGLLNKVACSVK